MTKVYKIAIIGCGYVGLELAKDRSEKGDCVFATTRNAESLDDLSKFAQKSVVFKEDDEEECSQIISNNDVIVITGSADGQEYFEADFLQLAHLFRRVALEMNLPRKIIYLSDIRVYGDHKGMWVDETCSLLGKGDVVNNLIETEQVYLGLEAIGWEVCVLRLGEIYGKGRETSERVKLLSSHPVAGDGHQFTNMIHLVDCVSAINFIIRHDLWGVYNLVDDDHQTRKELYDQVAKKFHLTPIIWDSSHLSMNSTNKRVSNYKIKKAGFKFTNHLRVLN